MKLLFNHRWWIHSHIKFGADGVLPVADQSFTYLNVHEDIIDFDQIPDISAKTKESA